MDWNFSFGWVILGIVILIAGILITVFYRQISDNFTAGIPYNKIKLVGVIVAIIGVAVMANLHTLILSGIVNLIFKR